MIEPTNKTKEFLNDFFKDVSFDDIESDCDSPFGMVVFYLQAFELWMEKRIATQEGGQNAQQLQPIIAQLVKARSWLVDSLAAPIDDNAVKDIDAVLSRLRAM